MVHLLIETSTERGVVALGTQEKIFFKKELPFGFSQSRFLMPEIENAIREIGGHGLLEAIVVGIGPGSYTGIRLGVSVAQGLSYAWKLPLVGVCSLLGFVPSYKITSFAAVIDARIAGAYVLRDKDTEPHVVALEEMGVFLQNISYVITPKAKPLQEKMEERFGALWQFEERYPCVEALFSHASSSLKTGRHVVHPPERLQLLYMRETEAERNKKKS